ICERVDEKLCRYLHVGHFLFRLPEGLTASRPTCDRLLEEMALIDFDAADGLKRLQIRRLAGSLGGGRNSGGEVFGDHKLLARYQQTLGKLANIQPESVPKTRGPEPEIEVETIDVSDYPNEACGRHYEIVYTICSVSRYLL